MIPNTLTYKILSVYTEYTSLYGPYLRKDGRKVVVLYNNKNLKRTTKQFSRLKMEAHLGKKLAPAETVDHIDGNPVNDSLTNLQILSRSDNSAKSAIRRNIVSSICPMCGAKFELSRSQISSHRKSTTIKIAGPFCSRTCIGSYGKNVQETGTTAVGKQVSVSYWNKDTMKNNQI